jgi:predicted phosphodiesterase
MNKKHVATLLVVAMVIVGGALAAYWLGMFPSSSSVDVSGGIVADQSEDSLTVWCYSPCVDLELYGYEGEVVLRNCIAEPEVHGADSAERIGNTSFRFYASGDEVSATVDPPVKDEFTFAVMGDSQGHNEVLGVILSELEGCDFAFLCGDLTPSGRESEFAAFQATINESAVPVYTTPGNHDVKADDDNEYRSRLGPPEYDFEYCGVRFAVVDSSDLNISAGQIDWIRGVFQDADRRVMMTHVPCYDPFGDNHTLWPESCERVLELIGNDGVDAVFAGHIHAFNHTRIAETEMVISGGAGATLVDGEHHYVKVSVGGTTPFDIHKLDLRLESQPTSFLSVTGRNGTTCNYTFEDLFAMGILEGNSSFENYFGNIGGEGFYTGVALSDLIDAVGGMEEGDVLRVTATDSYYQDFGYLNVYPGEDWLELQGVMLVALSLDSVSIPDWEDGPKLIMLASDGLYNNSDCEETSYEGQGYSVYPSAGARWVKNLATIQVIPCE